MGVMIGVYMSYSLNSLEGSSIWDYGFLRGILGV